MGRISLRITGIIFVIFLVFLLAARAAEPSVRPVLYEARPSFTLPTTTAPPTTTVPPTTTAPPTTTVAPITTVTVPPTTTVASTTTVPPTTTIPIDEIAVLSAPYQWGPNNEVVILQKVLGVDADGWYGPGTRSVHVSENEKRGLSLEGIPPVPTTTTTTTQPPVGPTESVTTIPAVTTPPISVIPTFGGMGAALVAQLLGQPCIADGDLSDCPPEVHASLRGLVG
jgi:hypothetical protein